jgi:lysophospholipid acyltransferase (LPLAT)-like uncharacterized protein
MSPEPSTPLTPSQRRKAAAIAAVGGPIIAVLGSTYRWRVDGFSHYESIVASGKPAILACWHGRILPGVLFWKHRGIVAIISQNFDGEWIARIIERFGYGTARGSTSRGGARALVQLRRDLAAGKSAVFTIDGPRGPARTAQAGVAWLAGATKHPILPFHIESNRFWTMNSWDRTQVPKPFSTVAVAIGKPIDVPDASEIVVEATRQELERVLGALEHTARGMLNAGQRPTANG